MESLQKRPPLYYQIDAVVGKRYVLVFSRQEVNILDTKLELFRLCDKSHPSHRLYSVHMSHNRSHKERDSTRAGTLDLQLPVPC